MNDQDVLLDLSTERRHKRIAIDGKFYEIATPQDFQLQEYLWLAEKGKEIQGFDSGSYTSAKLSELTKLLNKVVTKIMRTKLPRRVLRRLSNTQKISIMTAFIEAARIKEETDRPKLQDGTNSSHGSSDSMAAQ